ncbi:MAG: lipoyl(octanoyl) transferase LipB [Nannocystaceae bacterium]
MASTPERGAGPLRAVWLGRVPFEQTARRQSDMREAFVAGDGVDTVLLVEHPPTITVGRRGRREDIRWDAGRLAARGIAVEEAPRGGELTLHAPGQLVVYPVIRIGRRIRQHVMDLAETSIDLLGRYGVPNAFYDPDNPGVWSGRHKLASVGIHVSRGVAVQGLALNVDVDPVLFGSLVSCGMSDAVMVSVAQLTRLPVPPLPEIARAWATRFAERQDRELIWLPGVDAAG